MVLERVTFRLRDDVDDTAFLKAAAEVDGFLSDRPGYRSRQLYQGDDGRWIDLVLGEDLDTARAAAAIGADPRSAGFLGAIEPGSAVMSHSRPAHDPNG